MKKIILISAALGLILSGCAKETERNTTSPDKIAGPQTISAEYEATKVAMNDNGSAVSYTWKAGDRILFINPANAADSVRYTISSGIGETSASFTKAGGEFTGSNTYVCCHLGNGVRVSAEGEFTDKNGKAILKGQNPVHLENYMVFAGYSGSPKAYGFKGSEIPSSLGFEAPFTVLKVGVSNTSSSAVTPNGVKIDGGKGSNYFLGTLKVDATSGVAASEPVDFLQAGIWDGTAIAAGGEGACCVICAQNPSRSFSSLKVSIFY